MSVSPPDDLRVLVVDDHKIVRDGLEALLGALPGIAVVGTAGDGLEALAAVRELAPDVPDVVVMDVSMPNLSGVEATRRIVAEHAGARVLMLTMNEDLETIRGALRAGACGYLLKGAGADEVQHAIRTAASGGMVFGSEVRAAVVDVLTGREAPKAAPFPELTDRERGVLDLLASGRSNAEIAASVYLSDKSVRNLVSSIYAKLRVSYRAEAIIVARDAGLGRAAGSSR
ncbi:MAG TPA: response regulator transcription factor [Nocardioidaceae bacterium]|nr:response regulator transcription factor [Nocardioidaceae bacterium]